MSDTIAHAIKVKLLIIIFKHRERCVLPPGHAHSWFCWIWGSPSNEYKYRRFVINNGSGIGSKLLGGTFFTSLFKFCVEGSSGNGNIPIIPALVLDLVFNRQAHIACIIGRKFQIGNGNKIAS